MSFSISTLLMRNLHDVFGENDPARRRAAIDEILTEDCVFYEPGASTAAATRLIASRARSRLLTLTFDISQLPGPRNWAMAGASNGYRAALVRRQLTPGLISSLPATAGLPPFISFSTSYPELDSAVRRPIRRIASERFLQQHHESLGTTSATRRSFCSASSKTGLSRISSAPAPATSRRPCTQASGGP